MKITTTLEDVRGAASLCIKCGNCTYGAWPLNKPLCPLYYRDRCFTHSAGGLLYLVLALLNQDIKFNQSVADIAFACTGCLACDSNCGIIRSQSPHVDPWDIIRLLRRECVVRGIIPEGNVKQIHEEVQQRGDYGQTYPLNLPAKMHSEKAGTVIFAECAHTEAQKKIFDATASLLTKIGRPVMQFSEIGCCGSTLYDFGLWDDVKSIIMANWEKMIPYQDRTFVFINPHCLEFFTKRYPRTASESKAVKTRHISQLLSAALKAGKLKNKKLPKVRVSYHDPCHLGRGMGIYDTPREVLTALNGVELVEMERNRENSFCCGARATGSYFPDMSEWTAKERLKDFEATRADVLITACGYCKENFQKVLPENDKDRVKDLTEFVDERTN
jgi:Fe-S oxidoreductase